MPSISSFASSEDIIQSPSASFSKVNFINDNDHEVVIEHVYTSPESE